MLFHEPFQLDKYQQFELVLVRKKGADSISIKISCVIHVTI